MESGIALAGHRRGRSSRPSHDHVCAMQFSILNRELPFGYHLLLITNRRLRLLVALSLRRKKANSVGCVERERRGAWPFEDDAYGRPVARPCAVCVYQCARTGLPAFAWAHLFLPKARASHGRLVKVAEKECGCGAGQAEPAAATGVAPGCRGCFRRTRGAGGGATHRHTVGQPPVLARSSQHDVEREFHKSGKRCGYDVARDNKVDRQPTQRAQANPGGLMYPAPDGRELLACHTMLAHRSDTPKRWIQGGKFRFDARRCATTARLDRR